MKTLLSAKNLSCGYGRCPVLKGIDLEVREGEVLSLIGPNGAGKTTLLHTLAGLLTPLEGEVSLGGRSASRMSGRETARFLALAPQRATQSAWPLTVSEAVSLGRAPHRGWLLPFTHEDRRLIEKAMERMGVATLAERHVNTLSGGEVRRVLLARALAQAPKVLLLDEPATYLDLTYQAELLGLVRSLAREDGLAVVLTIHDLALASICSDRVALLSPGRLCAIGSVREVLSEEVLRPVYGENLEVLDHPTRSFPLVLPLPPSSVGAPPESHRTHDR